MFKKKVKILYHDKNCEIKSFGDWFDLSSAEDVLLKRNEYYVLSLGLSIKLPKYYELNIVPRSSTFKHFGVIQTNHFGVIDNEYCGKDDVIRFPVYCLRKESKINKYERICQGRINISQNAPWYVKIVNLFIKFKFIIVDDLDNNNRGGFGSSGK